MLTATLFLPLAGALLILLFLKPPKAVRLFAVGVTIVELALTSVVCFHRVPGRNGRPPLS